jgi:hypothetical protein
VHTLLVATAAMDTGYSSIAVVINSMLLETPPGYKVRLNHQI